MSSQELNAKDVLLLGLTCDRQPDGKVKNHLVMNPGNMQDALVDIMQALINAQMLLKIKIKHLEEMPDRINRALAN